MIKFRRAFYFRFVSGILIFFLLVQIKGLPVTEKDLELQFNSAKVDYNNAKYQEAKVRLERLEAAYRDFQDQKMEMKDRYGQILLLLGACHEKTGNSLKAKKYYEKGLKESQGSAFILESERDALPTYKKVCKKLISSGIIIKDGKPKKKRILLWAGGAAAVVLVLYLLLKKSKDSKTANIDISFSPNPVYPDSNGEWHYRVVLNETNGVGVTLTRMDYSPGTWQGGGPDDLFGTNYMRPNGTLSANILSRGYSNGSRVTFTFWGDDDNGHKNLKWSNSVTLEPLSNLTSNKFSGIGINDGVSKRSTSFNDRKKN